MFCLCLNIIHKNLGIAAHLRKKVRLKLPGFTSLPFPYWEKEAISLCNDRDEEKLFTLCWETWRNVVLLLNLTLVCRLINNYSGSFKTAFLQFISFVKTCHSSDISHVDMHIQISSLFCSFSSSVTLLTWTAPSPISNSTQKSGNYSQILLFIYSLRYLFINFPSNSFSCLQC